MSVHAGSDTYYEVKKLLGISEDEPVFVIRAQDDLAPAILTRYKNMAQQIEDPDVRPSSEWFDHMDAVISEFTSFRNANPERIKVPD